MGNRLDSRCTPISKCKSTEYEIRKPSQTHDRQCAPLGWFERGVKSREEKAQKREAYVRKHLERARAQKTALKTAEKHTEAASKAAARGGTLPEAKAAQQKEHSAKSALKQHQLIMATEKAAKAARVSLRLAIYPEAGDCTGKVV